jgi:hypothetical protein
MTFGCEFPPDLASGMTVYRGETRFDSIGLNPGAKIIPIIGGQ